MDKAIFSHNSEKKKKKKKIISNLLGGKVRGWIFEIWMKVNSEFELIGLTLSFCLDEVKHHLSKSS